MIFVGSRADDRLSPFRNGRAEAWNGYGSQRAGDDCRGEVLLGNADEPILPARAHGVHGGLQHMHEEIDHPVSSVDSARGHAETGGDIAGQQRVPEAFVIPLPLPGTGIGLRCGSQRKPHRLFMAGEHPLVDGQDVGGGLPHEFEYHTCPDRQDRGEIRMGKTPVVIRPIHPRQGLSQEAVVPEMKDVGHEGRMVAMVFIHDLYVIGADKDGQVIPFRHACVDGFDDRVRQARVLAHDFRADPGKVLEAAVHTRHTPSPFHRRLPPSDARAPEPPRT